jgi:hypothetical protein
MGGSLVAQPESATLAKTKSASIDLNDSDAHSIDARPLLEWCAELARNAAVAMPMGFRRGPGARGFVPTVKAIAVFVPLLMTSISHEISSHAVRRSNHASSVSVCFNVTSIEYFERAYLSAWQSLHYL